MPSSSSSLRHLAEDDMPPLSRPVEYCHKEIDSGSSAECRNFETCHVYIDQFVSYPIFKTVESSLGLKLSSTIVEKGTRKVFARIYTSADLQHCFVFVDCQRVTSGDFRPIVDVLTSKYRFKLCTTYDTINMNQSINNIRTPNALRFVAINVLGGSLNEHFKSTSSTSSSSSSSSSSTKSIVYIPLDIGIMIQGLLAELCSYCEVSDLSFIALFSNRTSALPIIDEAKLWEKAFPLINEILLGNDGTSTQGGGISNSSSSGSSINRISIPKPELYKESVKRDPFLIATESMYI